LTQGDVSSYEFFEMCHGYYVVTKFSKDNAVSGFRVCEKGKCDSLGSVRDSEDGFSDCEEEYT
jgi:hypothetical protein